MKQLFTEKYGPQEVRALSWKEPYGSLMLHGKAETRTYDVKYRGWVLICTSKSPYTFSKVIDISGFDQYNRMNSLLKEGFVSTDLGKAIAVGYLTSTSLFDYFGSDKAKRLEIEDKCFVRFQSGLWMHEYTDVQPIEHFDWKGQLGFKVLDDETKSKIVLI